MAGQELGRVLVASFPTPVPIGGVAVGVDLVRTLVLHGVQAQVWLPAEADKTDWDYGPVPTIVGMQLDIGPDDIVVLPETAVHPGADPAPGVRKVVYNQNHFYTMASWNSPEPPYSDWSPLPAVWTVSEEAKQVLDILTRRPSTVVPPRVEYQRFAPTAKDRGSVTLMPRKRPRQAEVLVRLLKERFAGLALPLDVTLVEGLTSDEVARVLQRTSVFIALSRTEGLGLPVQEALAAACHVVGYSGGGGHSLYQAPCAHLVGDDDVMGIVERVTSIVAHGAVTAPENRDWLQRHRPESQAVASLLAAVQAVRRTPASAGTARHPVTDFGVLPGDFFTAI